MSALNCILMGIYCLFYNTKDQGRHSKCTHELESWEDKILIWDWLIGIQRVVLARTPILERDKCAFYSFDVLHPLGDY